MAHGPSMGTLAGASDAARRSQQHSAARLSAAVAAIVSDMAVYVTCDSAMLLVLDRLVRAKWLRLHQSGLGGEETAADAAPTPSVKCAPGGEPETPTAAQDAAAAGPPALPSPISMPLVSPADSGRVLGVVLIKGNCRVYDLQVEAIRAVAEEIASPLPLPRGMPVTASLIDDADVMQALASTNAGVRGPSGTLLSLFGHLPVRGLLGEGDIVSLECDLPAQFAPQPSSSVSMRGVSSGRCPALYTSSLLRLAPLGVDSLCTCCSPAARALAYNKLTYVLCVVPSAVPSALFAPAAPAAIGAGAPLALATPVPAPAVAPVLPHSLSAVVADEEAVRCPVRRLPKRGRHSSSPSTAARLSSDDEDGASSGCDEGGDDEEENEVSPLVRPSKRQRRRE